MRNLDTVLAQLRQERDHLNQVIAALEAVNSNGASSSGTRFISAAGRQRIAAAQRARWAKVRGERKVARKMSSAARERIAAAQRKRWAEFRKQKKAA